MSITIRTTIAAAGNTAAGLLFAPLAAADGADDLTNIDVAANTETASRFERFDTGIEPVLGTGGQGPYPHNQDYTFDPDGPDGPIAPITKNYGPFDDGVSDSTRAMRDRVNYYANLP